MAGFPTGAMPYLPRMMGPQSPGGIANLTGMPLIQNNIPQAQGPMGGVPSMAPQMMPAPNPMASPLPRDPMLAQQSSGGMVNAGMGPDDYGALLRGMYPQSPNAPVTMAGGGRVNAYDDYLMRLRGMR